MRAPLLRFGVFELDIERQELRRSGRLVPLQRQPFRTLALLAARAGEVVTREELRQELWPDGTHVDFERGINFCIGQVRLALRDPARSSHFVETRPRVGYRFLVPVDRPVAAPASAPAPAAPSPAHRGVFWLKVACLLAVTLGATPSLRHAPATTVRTPQGAGQEAYLRALFVLQQKDARGLEEAAGWLERAVASEPDDATAQAALARVLVELGRTGGRPAATAMPAARLAALAALRGDPRQVEARLALAAVRLTFDWDWGAVEDVTRVLELEPENAPALRMLATFLAARGDHERAIEAGLRAASLEPLCPTIQGELGWLYYCAGRFPEAAAHWTRSVAVNPENGPRDRVVDAYRQLRQPALAWDWARGVMRHAGVAAHTTEELERRGPAGALQAFLAGSIDYLTHQGAPPERLAALHAALEHRDHALALLEKAADERSAGLLATLAVDPDFRILDAEPRYQVLLRRTGLEAGTRRVAAREAACRVLGSDCARLPYRLIRS